MKQIFLICSLGLILFMTGCASVHTWQAIGYEVFQPESHHLEKLPDGRILLTQQGMVKEYPAPQPQALPLRGLILNSVWAVLAAQ